MEEGKCSAKVGLVTPFTSESHSLKVTLDPFLLLPSSGTLLF